tara:strand:+ start:1536 stop:2207 length:672 start_codon:yes stop_codon:yes gene_type:complete
MPQSKSKKILVYFFLFISVGSINNSTLKELKFEKIKHIEISGLNNYYKEIILKDINDLKLENIFLLNKKDLVDVISLNPFVENYNIFKKYPFTLDIKIQQTILIAKINKNGKTFYVGSNGKLSKKNFSDKELPFIFGKPNILEFLQLKKKIDQSKFSYEEIKNLYFFPSKRWDIELKNKIILKLPKDNIRNSLDHIFQFLKNDSFNKIKIVDARVNNQIILND